MSHFDAIELLTRYETPLIKDMEKDDDVLEWVAAFVGSEGFQDRVTDYCATHADKFAILLAKGGPSSADLDAVEELWKQLHEEFIDTANAFIEEFLVTHGFTMEQYEARCDEEVALSEERQRHTRMSFFVQILMSCCEYEQFLNLMRRVADPEYYDKKELQYEAESILCEANGSSDAAAAATAPAASTEQELRAKKAQDFLDFFQANPEVSLDELTREFQKRMEIS